MTEEGRHIRRSPRQHATDGRASRTREAAILPASSSTDSSGLKDIMLTSSVRMMLVAVAMTTMVAMVTGQKPSDEQLKIAVANAVIKAQSAKPTTCRAPCPDGEHGALQALAAEHRPSPMAEELSHCDTVVEYVIEYLLDRNFTLDALFTTQSSHVTDLCKETSLAPITCPSPANPEFRTADGRCNNRNHSLWGSADQPFRRLLPPEYGDGFRSPRTKGRNGVDLPTARRVSSVLHQHTRDPSSVNTHMVMQFGQFLDHDITLTPTFAEGEGGVMCDCDCEDSRCFNIPLAPDDTDFSGRRCLEFSRSRSSPPEGCQLGPRQQLNQLTAFVDASNVYGSSDELLHELRAPPGPLPYQGTCPTGFSKFRESCFKAFPTATDPSWIMKHCQNAGGFLAMPKDSATNAFLVTLKNSVRTDVPFRIGLGDAVTEGEWRYADGTLLGSGYSNWNQAPSTSGSTDCAFLLAGTSGKWTDMACSGNRYYICQVILPAEPPLPTQPNQGSNLARNKQTQQSGTYSNFVSPKAADGSQSRSSSHCTYSAHQWRPWWRVDLGTSQCIGNVVVYHYNSKANINLFQLHVGDSPNVEDNPQCGSNHMYTGNAPFTVNCGGRRGRYVGILLPGSTKLYLRLCEVEVYKAASCSQFGARGLLDSRPNPADSNKMELLPGAGDSEFNVMCDEFTENATCSKAGDIRVNEQPGLTSMHTVFLREHNRIARRLSTLNLHWDDDRVFYETRKIVGALMQKITYGEDLPHVLGPDAMAKFGLTLTQSGFFTGYDATVNPTIFNVFATGAYRFGHSLVKPQLARPTPDFTRPGHCPIQLASSFFNPLPISDNDAGGPDSILRGLTAQPHEEHDRFVVAALSKVLFAVPPGSNRGLDLPGLNTQRGRDHGLPAYNDWRQKCGLDRANSFIELALDIPDTETRRRLELVYRHVDDIDLFTGGLSEKSVPGGIVGETFACLIGLQFHNLRKGDRFWFENRGQFTAEQLAELKKSSLARILCDNTDGTTTMQPDVFTLPGHAGEQNERVACSILPEMDLTQWQE